MYCPKASRLDCVVLSRVTAVPGPVDRRGPLIRHTAGIPKVGALFRFVTVL